MFKSFTFRDKDYSSEEEGDERSLDESNSQSQLKYSVHCVKTHRQKDLILDVFKSIIIQKSQRGQKIIRCKDIQNVVFDSQKNQLSIEIKRKEELVSKQKIFNFEIGKGVEFKTLVDFCNTDGDNCRYIFYLLDKFKTKSITKASLFKVLKEFEIAVEHGDANKMFPKDKAEIDYQDFFHACMALSPLHSPRQFLLDWLHSARLDQNVLDRKGFVGSWLSIDDCFWHSFPGEYKANVFEHMRWKVNSKVAFAKNSKVSVISGLAYITNYRILLVSALKYSKHARSARYDPPTFFDEISVPLSAILRVEVSADNGLLITTKDNRSVYMSALRIAGASVITDFADALQSILSKAYQPFAYQNRRHLKVDGWDFMDLSSEYERLGFNEENGWNIVENTDWTIVWSYPKLLAVPYPLSEDSLVNSLIVNRVDGRAPVASYRHSNNCVILLSSFVIPSNLASGSDDVLLSSLLREGELGQQRMALLGIQSVSAGDPSSVGVGDLLCTNKLMKDIIEFNVFLFPDFRSLRQCLSNFCISLQNSFDSSNYDEKYSKALSTSEGTEWLLQISSLIASAVKIAEKIHLEEVHVLLASDNGRDRALQLSALSQVLLDPHYRTLEGFLKVVEKEFCGFGFNFIERNGPFNSSVSSASSENRSPLFLQFLDAIYQLTCQFPSAFEFNTELLIFLADHSDSGLFGTFLNDSQRNRLCVDHANELTVSIWGYILTYKSLFVQPTTSYKALSAIMWPNPNINRLQIWSRYFCRWFPDCHPIAGHDNLGWHDDWGAGEEAKKAAVSRRQTQYRMTKGEQDEEPSASSASAATTHDISRVSATAASNVATTVKAASAAVAAIDSIERDINAQQGHSTINSEGKPIELHQMVDSAFYTYTFDASASGHPQLIRDEEIERLNNRINELELGTISCDEMVNKLQMQLAEAQAFLREKDSAADSGRANLENKIFELERQISIYEKQNTEKDIELNILRGDVARNGIQVQESESAVELLLTANSSLKIENFHKNLEINQLKQLLSIAHQISDECQNNSIVVLSQIAEATREIDVHQQMFQQLNRLLTPSLSLLSQSDSEEQQQQRVLSQGDESNDAEDTHLSSLSPHLRRLLSDNQLNLLSNCSRLCSLLQKQKITISDQNDKFTDKLIFLQQTEIEYEKLLQIISEDKEQIENLNKQLNDSNLLCNSLRNHLTNALEEVQSLTEIVNNSKLEESEAIQKLRSEILSKQREAEQLSETIAQKDIEISEIKSSNEKAISELNSNLSESIEKLIKLESEKDSLSMEVTTFQESQPQLEQLESERQQLYESVGICKSDIMHKQEEINHLESRISELEDDNQELSDLMEKVKSDCNEKSRQISKLTTELKEIDCILSENEKQLRLSVGSSAASSSITLTTVRSHKVSQLIGRVIELTTSVRQTDLEISRLTSSTSASASASTADVVDSESASTSSEGNLDKESMPLSPTARGIAPFLSDLRQRQYESNIKKISLRQQQQQLTEPAATSTTGNATSSASVTTADEIKVNQSPIKDLRQWQYETNLKRLQPSASSTSSKN